MLFCPFAIECQCENRANFTCMRMFAMCDVCVPSTSTPSSGHYGKALKFGRNEWEKKKHTTTDQYAKHHISYSVLFHARMQSVAHRFFLCCHRHKDQDAEKKPTRAPWNQSEIQLKATCNETHELYSHAYDELKSKSYLKFTHAKVYLRQQNSRKLNCWQVESSHNANKNSVCVCVCVSVENWAADQKKNHGKLFIEWQFLVSSV